MEFTCNLYIKMKNSLTMHKMVIESKSKVGLEEQIENILHCFKDQIEKHFIVG